MEKPVAYIFGIASHVVADFKSESWQGHERLVDRDDEPDDRASSPDDLADRLNLQQQLEREGHVFRTHSDTEALVHLYERDGDRMVDALRGMFTFAIWDHRRERLLLARDRVGIKPLYLWRTSWGVAFASEMRAFLGIVCAAVFVIAAYLVLLGVYGDFFVALRYAAFNVVSAATTTGYATVDYAAWPLFAALPARACLLHSPAGSPCVIRTFAASLHRLPGSRPRARAARSRR